MSRRITRSQTICLAKPSEFILGSNRRKSAPPNKVGKRLTLSNRAAPLSKLNAISANISTSALKEISNVINVKPTIPKRKKFDSTDEIRKVSTVKSTTTTSSTKVDNVSFNSNSIFASKEIANVLSQRRLSIVVKKLEATTIKSGTATSSTKADKVKSNSILASKENVNVVSQRRLSIVCKRLEATTIKGVTATSSTKVDNVNSNSILTLKEKEKIASQRKSVDEENQESTTINSLSTISSKVDDRITSTVSHKKVKALAKEAEAITKESPAKTSSAKKDGVDHQDTSFPSIAVVSPKTNFVSKISRRKSVPSETSVGKTPEVITNEPNSTTSSTKVNQIQDDEDSLTSNLPVVDKNVKAARISYTTPSIPLRRSARISKKESTPENSQIPSPAQPAKIKGRRCTVHLFQREVPKTIVNTSVAISTKAARRADTVSVHSLQTEAPNTTVDTSAPIMMNTTNVAHRANNMKAINEIIISNDLKIVLLNDTRIVNGQNKLYKIPTKLNVAKVIEDYTATKSLDDAHSSGLTLEVLFFGIIEHFEVLLGNQLLYELERVQYEEILHKYPGIAMSKVYPPVYLLRLLVRLNKLLVDSKRDKETLKWIINHVNDFVKYLAERKSELFDLTNFC